MSRFWPQLLALTFCLVPFAVIGQDPSSVGHGDAGFPAASNTEQLAKPVAEKTQEVGIEFWTFIGTTSLVGLGFFGAGYLLAHWHENRLLKKEQHFLEDLRALHLPLKKKLETMCKDVADLSQAVYGLRETNDNVARIVDELATRLPPVWENPPPSAHFTLSQPAVLTKPGMGFAEDSYGGEVSRPSSITATDSPEENFRQPAEDVIPPPSVSHENLGPLLGEIFLSKAQQSASGDFSQRWESFTASLRQRSDFGQVTSRPVYWDRSASERFVERKLDSFLDTASCYLLSVKNGEFLFFPKLLEPARQNDLPHCRIRSSGGPILSAENLVRFVPPRVQQGADGWVVTEEGEVEYR